MFAWPLPCTQKVKGASVFPKANFLKILKEEHKVKTKKPSRIISLLLAAVMTIGTLPISSITSTAAEPAATTTAIPVNADWTVIGVPGTTESDNVLYTQLQSAMNAESTGTRYIRLGEDIDFKYSAKKKLGVDPSTFSLQVRGDVVFDLNGYRLDVNLSVHILSVYVT